MRFILAMVFAGLVALPVNVSAQAGEEGPTTEPRLQEPQPSSEPAPEEPALQLKLDDTGVEVAPPPPRTADGYTRAEMDRRIRNAKIGVVVSVFPILIGGVLAASALSGGVLQVPPPSPEEAARDDRLGIAAATLVSGGAASMLTTGILLGVRKRKLRRLEEAEYRRLRRVQWDLETSRLVF